MIVELVVAFLGILVGYGVGLFAHEIAHYVVLAATGYRPTIEFWPPPAKVTDWSTPTPIPVEVRIAALAPAILGLAVAVVGFAASVVEPLLFPFVLGAVIQLCWLSPQDRDMALGGPELLAKHGKEPR